MGAASVDAQVLRELERVPLELPPGLEISWLGVSGYRLTYEGVSLLIDPYVSRVPLRSLLLRRRALPDESLISRFIHVPGEVAGILIGHTHFDHAIDAPAIARRFQTKAYGSASLAHLMRLHGLAGLSVEVVPHRPYELGPFVVTFIPSRHSKLLFGERCRWTASSPVTICTASFPPPTSAGRSGGSVSRLPALALYHQGSADLDDGELGDDPVDLFLAGIAGRSVTPRYWERILPRLDPRLVVPTHYDDFFAPLGQEEKLIRGAKVEDLPGEIAAVSGDARIAALRRVDQSPRA